MNKKIRLALGAFLGTVGLVIGFWCFNFTVTPLDRPFFLSGNSETIVVTRVSWMCNCADFVDSASYNTNQVTEPAGDDYFFIEAAQVGQNWDRNHFIDHQYARLTGQFYLDKGIPSDYKLGHMEDKPNHARVFRFEKIEYLTD